ncbi:hypothetical protein, partial [Gallintestinimicrobium sp.]|uniref:hypothetical protein n=1 Tax=Gallintestinimicrobium sp. TaxID=2981655 RepID=UPI0039933279
ISPIKFAKLLHTSLSFKTIQICKYFLNAFVNFFLQKHYKLIFGFLKIIVLKFLSNRVEGGD